MIDDPKTYIPRFIGAGADFITFHVETACDIGDRFDLIEEGGAVPGLSTTLHRSVGLWRPGSTGYGLSL